MRLNCFLLAYLGGVLVTAPVLAQTSQPVAPPTQPNASVPITQSQTVQWRTSNLEWLEVYSSNNGDKLGEISDLIFDSSGKVHAVVIGVGGYLGIGERDIAVLFDQIGFVTEPRSNTTGTTTGEARLADNSPGGDTVASPAATGTATVPAGPNSSATSNTAANNASAPAAPGAPRAGQVAAGASGSTPDHAVLLMSITKDELRAAPEFRPPR